MKYRLVEALSSKNLIAGVNILIQEGWKPIGGISITGEFHGTLVYVQAMSTNNMSLKLPGEE